MIKGIWSDEGSKALEERWGMRRKAAMVYWHITVHHRYGARGTLIH